MKSRTFTLFGAALGLVAFLGLGLLPSMLYGGYAGVLLAGGVLGTPVTAGFLTRAFIVGGMVLGTVGVASLFIVGGTAVGAMISVMVPFTEASACPRPEKG